ncbi:TPA: tail fiber protein [Yersinia enterocolitica]|uniref:phage tail protein n=1 Tax=Yersinia enterocolitica TaxID=630 RepID=UPI0021E72822|nr:phage tail protein [Yersinia enterocolitica]UYJ85501.1 phage tail protein [Yersinia enterocolitica]UYK14882.1 phage tail protein [Yersinia enterocolitica]HEN3469389.1 tail fiber protein [Yersinia enterocolitica]
MQKIGDIPNTRADSNGEFTDGNVAGGVPPTILPAAWFNTIQRELMSVLSAAEIDADSAQFNQVLLSIQKLIGEGIPDIKDASLTQKGIVQLSSSITSTSEALAATPKAVKTANDAALQKSANLSDLANVQTALTNLGLTGIGIGLPTQLAIVNFDFQNFTFTSGANYLASTANWINPPAGVTYPSGLTVSITVTYVANSTNYIAFTLRPHAVTNSNYRVYEVISVGAPGSRVFTVREEWNSANPIPVNGGGTGATTAAGALVNLGLGEGSLIPIGVPLPYPLATAPTGYLKCNGSSFSTTAYPQLAVAYPSGVLPDLRAFTIRGWDDGRGIDTGRTLLSEQADALQNITGGMIDMITSTTPSASGAFALTNNIIGYTDQTARSGRIVNFNFDASRIARTAAETRVRNIAFNYIVRAI